MSTFKTLMRNLKSRLKSWRKSKSHIKKFWYWILKFKGYRHVVQKVCKKWANFGSFHVKNVLKTYYEEEKTVVTKTTDESQTSTNESQTSHRRVQTSHRRPQTSHRRLQTSHRRLQTNHRRLQASHRELQTNQRQIQLSHR